MFDWFGSATTDRLNNLEQWRDWFNWKVRKMAGELEALKAAVAADAEMDAKFVAAVGSLVVQVSDLTAKLNEIASREVIDPVEVLAVADALTAHVADMSTHLPAAPAPVEPVVEPVPVDVPVETPPSE